MTLRKCMVFHSGCKLSGIRWSKRRFLQVWRWLNMLWKSQVSSSMRSFRFESSSLSPFLPLPIPLSACSIKWPSSSQSVSLSWFLFSSLEGVEEALIWPHHVPQCFNPKPTFALSSSLIYIYLLFSDTLFNLFRSFLADSRFILRSLLWFLYTYAYIYTYIQTHTYTIHSTLKFLSIHNILDTLCAFLVVIYVSNLTPESRIFLLNTYFIDLTKHLSNLTCIKSNLHKILSSLHEIYQKEKNQTVKAKLEYRIEYEGI